MTKKDFEDNDDFEVDDILSFKNKKKIKSKNKGNRGELDITKILTKRFNQPFNRVVGSGNRWSQISHVSKDYVGDIVVPERFRFSIEVKFGYPEIDSLTSCLHIGFKNLDDFLQQTYRDAKVTNRDPMLCYRPQNKPWSVFVQHKNNYPNMKTIPTVLFYKHWVACSLKKLLELDNDFFFNQS